MFDCDYKLVIFGRPFSVNRTYRAGRKGRGKRNIYISREAGKYASDVGYQAKSNWRNGILRQNLEVTFVYFFHNYQRRDHLNFNKLLNDHLNQIVWQDDTQIKISHHYTKVDRKNPRVELYIKIL